MPKTKKQEIGNTGELIAARFLMKHGFSVIERNYRKKWGEIDIILVKKGKTHFVEVKTVSYETTKEVTRETKEPTCLNRFSSFFRRFLPVYLQFQIMDVTDRIDIEVAHETSYRPEDNLHYGKLKCLERTIQSYLSEKGESIESDWYFDIVTVRLDKEKKVAKVEFLEDVIL